MIFILKVRIYEQIFIYIISDMFLFSYSASAQEEGKNVTIKKLATMFYQPPMNYRPYVWWYWMGSNFSEAGITKDLEAMKGGLLISYQKNIEV